MKIKQITETTTAGGIAPVAAPMGKVQKRAGSLFKGKKTNKPFYEDEIKEQDLIMLPGQIRKKDKSFIPHDKDRRDHEVEMARSDLYAAAKNAMRIFQLLKDRTEDEGLMGWQQSYITLASDYLNSVADSIEYDNQMNEVLGGVIAGGMSNFEESTQRVDSLVTDALKIMRGSDVTDAIQALKTVLGDREFSSRRGFYNFYIKQLVDMYGKQGVAEGEVDEAKKQGLWANIHAKRERIKHGSGERMRKPGSKGAPSAQDFKDSQKTSKK